mgnify:CR=1 FL=1
MSLQCKEAGAQQDSTSVAQPVAMLICLLDARVMHAVWRYVICVSTMCPSKAGADTIWPGAEGVRWVQERAKGHEHHKLHLLSELCKSEG